MNYCRTFSNQIAKDIIEIKEKMSKIEIKEEFQKRLLKDFISIGWNEEDRLCCNKICDLEQIVNWICQKRKEKKAEIDKIEEERRKEIQRRKKEKKKFMKKEYSYRKRKPRKWK